VKEEKVSPRELSSNPGGEVYPRKREAERKPEREEHNKGRTQGVTCQKGRGGAYGEWGGGAARGLGGSKGEGTQSVKKSAKKEDGREGSAFPRGQEKKMKKL